MTSFLTKLQGLLGSDKDAEPLNAPLAEPPLPKPKPPVAAPAVPMAQVVEQVTAAAASQPDDIADIELGEMEEIEDAIWSEARLNLAQKIWGAGFCRPGGTEYTKQQIKYFSPLSEGMQFLDANAGLGGTLLTLADGYPLSLQGMEALEIIHRTGRGHLARMGQQVIPLRLYNPELIELPKENFDCIYARDLLSGVGNKTRLLQQFCLALKERGQLLVVDLMLAENSDARAVRRWMAQQSISSVPLSAADCEKAIRAQADMEWRGQEDITDSYIREIISGWGHYLRELSHNKPGKKFLDMVLREVVYWAELVELLQKGQLRYIRAQARCKPAAERKA